MPVSTLLSSDPPGINLAADLMKTKSSSQSAKPSAPRSNGSLRPHSSIVLDGPERAPSRAMLYPVGFKPEDFTKPLIGIASTWSMVTPCNMHIDKLAIEAEKGANEAGGKAIIFNTISVSDGISMGSEGMKYSLVSRDVIDDAELQAIESCAIPGPGSCGGMYTANTMASAIEALGMSLPNSSAQAAVSPAKKKDCLQAGAAVVNLIQRGIKPLDIMTRKAFENAITVVIALGGSTNAVLHLLAMANAASVKLELDDFTRIGERVPVLADLKPSGKHLMSELVAIGGIRPMMKTLLDAGLLHGDCLTVTGKTLREDLTGVQPYPKGQTIIRPLNDPIKKDSHLVVLYGNLSPEGGVAK